MTIDSSFMATAQSRDLKVVVLGAERTGKTALVRKYIHSTFSEEYNSPSDAVNIKHVSVDGQIYTLNLFPAQPLGESHLCQIGQAFLLLYAINNKKSFHHIRQQHNQLKEAKGATLSSTPVFLVGTKVHLRSERQVSLQEARKLAIELRCQKLFETSVRDQSEEINDLFTKVIRQYQTFEQGRLTTSSPPPPSMNPSPSTPAPPMSSPKAESPRRGSVLDRLKFGSLKRKSSIASLARKKSGSFSESITSLASAKQSRENVRNTPYGQSNIQNESISIGNSNGISNSYTRNYSNGTVSRKSTSGSPYRLDVNTSAWRDTIKWPTEIIPEEDLRV